MITASEAYYLTTNDNPNMQLYYVEDLIWSAIEQQQSGVLVQSKTLTPDIVETLIKHGFTIKCHTGYWSSCTSIIWDAAKYNWE